MNKPKNSKHDWLKIGYELFGEEGPEGIQVERLARILNVNKSSFYHFHCDKEIFIDELLEMHRIRADEMENKTLLLKEFDPGFISLMLEFKETVLFHRQLLRNGEFQNLKETFDSINNSIDLAILPLWKMEVELPEKTAYILFGLMRDNFYARMNHKNFSETLIREIINEFKLFLSKIQHQEVTSR